MAGWRARNASRFVAVVSGTAVCSPTVFVCPGANQGSGFSAVVPLWVVATCSHAASHWAVCPQHSRTPFALGVCRGSRTSISATDHAELPMVFGAQLAYDMLRPTLCKVPAQPALLHALASN
jgi:hypothetical protein